MTNSTGIFKDCVGPQPFIKTATVLSLLESLTIQGIVWMAMGLQGHVPGKILLQGKELQIIPQAIINL